MNRESAKQQIFRFLIYGMGIVILALGITLNTKTGLGVSALVSIAYTVAGAWNRDWNDSGNDQCRKSCCIL